MLIHQLPSENGAEGKRNSAPIIEQRAQRPHTAQVNLLWPTILTHSSPSRDLCLGRIKFQYT